MQGVRDRHEERGRAEVNRALAAALLAFCVGPASAQWRVPDVLPPLPEDGQVCNDKNTHCVVNFADWFGNKFGMQLYAITAQVQQQRITELEAELARESASKTKTCAKVTAPPDQTCKKS